MSDYIDRTIFFLDGGEDIQVYFWMFELYIIFVLKSKHNYSIFFWGGGGGTKLPTILYFSLHVLCRVYTNKSMSFHHTKHIYFTKIIAALAKKRFFFRFNAPVI